MGKVRYRREVCPASINNRFAIAALLENGMRKIKKFGLVTIAVIVVLVGLWMYHAHGLYKKSYRSEYYYVITVESNSILHDVTIFVPIPLFEEESKIGDQIIAGKTSKPDDWDCSIVETEHGKMLEISVAKITPVLVSEGISANVEVDRDITTKNPVGNEPLLSPEYNLTRSICELPYPEGRVPPVCYEYESRIYADYTASPDATVSIYIELGGENSWWIYGWSSNHYHDRISITFTGEQHGWYIVSGKLVEGEGRYGWI